MDQTQHATLWRIARILAGLGAAVVLGYAAFGFLLFGMIVFTGCFFECSDPNHLGGIALLTGAVLAAAGGFTVLVWGFIGGPLRQLRTVLGGSVAVFGLLLVVMVVVGA